jgi:hypothetical protein
VLLDRKEAQCRSRIFSHNRDVQYCKALSMCCNLLLARLSYSWRFCLTLGMSYSWRVCLTLGAFVLLLAHLSYSWHDCLTLGDFVLLLARLSYSWRICLTLGTIVLLLARLSYSWRVCLTLGSVVLLLECFAIVGHMVAPTSSAWLTFAAQLAASRLPSSRTTMAFVHIKECARQVASVLGRENWRCNSGGQSAQPWLLQPPDLL